LIRLNAADATQVKVLLSPDRSTGLSNIGALKAAK
jgi:hypothetical protein